MKLNCKYPANLPPLVLNLRYQYTVQRQVLRKNRVQITVSVGTNIIGERMTASPLLFAAACYVDHPDDIAQLKEAIPRMRALADFHEAMQRRDPDALRIDLRNRACDESDSRYVAERDERIELGEHGAFAEKTRRMAAILLRKLASAPAMPQNQSSRPYIYSWHERHDLVPRKPYHARLIEVLEIPTGLPKVFTRHESPKDQPPPHP